MLEQGPSINSRDITTGQIHSVFNNIWVVRNSRRWPTGNNQDAVSGHMSCEQSTAGTQRYDYNCTTAPACRISPPAFYLVQHQATNQASYASLAAFRASPHKTTSLSMYSDGTDGHEAHRVQVVTPGWWTSNSRLSSDPSGAWSAGQGR